MNQKLVIPGSSRICVRDTQWYSPVEMTQSAQGPLAPSSSIFLQVFKPYLHRSTQSLVAVAIRMLTHPREPRRKPLSWRQEFAMVRKKLFTKSGQTCKKSSHSTERSQSTKTQKRFSCRVFPSEIQSLASKEWSSKFHQELYVEKLSANQSSLRNPPVLVCGCLGSWGCLRRELLPPAGHCARLCVHHQGATQPLIHSDVKHDWYSQVQMFFFNIFFNKLPSTIKNYYYLWQKIMSPNTKTDS